MMPWLCDTDGLLQISHLSAIAATTSLLNMHCHVPKEVFPPSGTMKSSILRPIFSQKCVARCTLNPICSQLRQTNCLEPLSIHRTGQGLMSQLMECGVGDLKRHFLMRVSTACTPLTKLSMNKYINLRALIPHAKYLHVHMLPCRVNSSPLIVFINNSILDQIHTTSLHSRRTNCAPNTRVLTTQGS